MDIHIFGAGSYPADILQIVAKLKNKLLSQEQKTTSLIITADGGLEILYKAKVEPDLVIGDFDSLHFLELLHQINPLIPVYTLAKEKDFSDMYYACQFALKKITEERDLRDTQLSFYLWGSLGGRLDHSLANISLMHSLILQGHKCCLIGDTEIVTIFTEAKTYDLHFADVTTFSLFAYNENVQKLNIKDCHYEVTDFLLTSTEARGLSNSSYQNISPKISFEQGTLLLTALHTANGFFKTFDLPW